MCEIILNFYELILRILSLEYPYKISKLKLVLSFIKINMPKSSFDKNMEKVSEEFDKVADDVKDTAADIGNRWTRSTTEEKITMILGIALLVRALFELADIIWWVILLTLGLLLVSGFFDRPLRDLIRYCKKELKWGKKVAVDSDETSEKVKVTKSTKSSK